MPDKISHPPGLTRREKTGNNLKISPNIRLAHTREKRSPNCSTGVSERQIDPVIPFRRIFRPAQLDGLRVIINGHDPFRTYPYPIDGQDTTPCAHIKHGPGLVEKGGRPLMCYPGSFQIQHLCSLNQKGRSLKGHAMRVLSV